MSATHRARLHLGYLTGEAARAALAARPVLLLPLGSHESHGPSLPMGDYVLAEEIGLSIAARADDQGVHCLVAPALPFGGADYFGSVPGAIALAPETLRAVLTDMIDALLRHRIDRLIVLNGHAGNTAAIHEVTLSARRRHGVIIPSFYLWKAARTLMQQDPAMAAPGRCGHGGDPLASIARHLLALPPLATAIPRPVHVFDLPVTDFASVTLEGVAIDLPLELDEVAPDGIAPGADPSAANAEDGAVLTERLVRIGAALVRRVAGRSA